MLFFGMFFFIIPAGFLAAGFFLAIIPPLSLVSS